jgi:hypothetical protein
MATEEDRPTGLLRRGREAREVGGVVVDRGTDPVLVLAITVAVDAMSHD